MKIAGWIIAEICEVVRAVQNSHQIRTIDRDAEKLDGAYAEFVKSLKSSDREFIKALRKEFDEKEGDDVREI